MDGADSCCSPDSRCAMVRSPGYGRTDLVDPESGSQWCRCEAPLSNVRDAVGRPSRGIKARRGNRQVSLAAELEAVEGARREIPLEGDRL